MLNSLTGSLSNVSFSFLLSFLRISAGNMVAEPINVITSAMRISAIKHVITFTCSDTYPATCGGMYALLFD